MGRNYSQAGLLTMNISKWYLKKSCQYYLKGAVCDFSRALLEFSLTIKTLKPSPSPLCTVCLPDLNRIRYDESEWSSSVLIWSQANFWARKI